jgi:hypothetical protein
MRGLDKAMAEALTEKELDLLRIRELEEKVAELKFGLASAQEFVAAFERAAKYQLGKTVEGKGVYMGVWEPVDQKSGEPIAGKYHVFASEKELANLDGRTMHSKFGEVAAEFAQRREWNGYRLAGYADEGGLRKALAAERYKGEWIVPPREFVDGRDADGKKVRLENLTDMTDFGDFKEINRISDGWYWSCTMKEDSIFYANVRSRDGLWATRSDGYAGCRPFRLEPV